MMSTEPDWSCWQAFGAALETGSIAAAARRLRLSQATVRSRIEALEARLGTVLFVRTSGGLQPTDHAAAMSAQLASMRSISGALVRMSTGTPGSVSGVVRLSTFEFVGTVALPPMLSRLFERHPRLSVALAPDDASLDLAGQEADIALRMHRPSGDGLIVRKIGSARLGFYAAQVYVERRGQPSDVENLLAHDVIGPDRSRYDRTLAERFDPALAASHYVLRTDNHATVLSAVRAGIGIGVVQRPIGDADPTLVPILADRDFAEIETFVAAHRDLRRLPRIAAMFDWLVEEFRRYA